MPFGAKCEVYPFGIVPCELVSGRVRAGMGTADRAAAAADGRAGSCPRSELARDRRALAGWLAGGGVSVAGRVESIPCVCSVRRWGIQASTVRSQSERSIQLQREIDGAPVATAGEMPTGAIDMCGYISAE